MAKLTEMWGRPGDGKTHLSHAGWPAPLHLDTAMTQIRTQDHEVEVAEGDHGESWEVVAKLHEWDVEEAEKHYRYVTSFDQVREEVLDAPDWVESIIIDNTYDLKALAIKKFLADSDQKWIQQIQYGGINDMVDEITQWIKQQGYHVVWVTQTKEEYRNNASTGEYVPDGPKRADHRADFRLEVVVEDDERHVYVRKNRYLDPTDDSPYATGGDLGGSVELIDLLLGSGLDEEFW